MHDVLDHDDCDALIVQDEQRLQHFVDFALRKPRHDFVRDQEERLGCERARELELAQFEVGKQFGRMIGAGFEADQREQLARARRIVVSAMHIVQRNPDVLKHAYAYEGPRNLETARHAEPGASICRPSGDVSTVENNCASFGAQHSRDAIDQCRLS